MSPDRFEVRRVPLERLPQIETLRVFAHRPIVHGLLAVDVTEARRRIGEEGERSGDRPSFTAFLIGCLPRAVDEDRQVQRFRRGGGSSCSRTWTWPRSCRSGPRTRLGRGSATAGPSC